MARRFIEPLGLGNDGPPFGYCMTEWRDALMYDWLEHGIVGRVGGITMRSQGGVRTFCLPVDNWTNATVDVRLYRP